MQDQETGRASGLSVHLEISGPVIAGLTVLAHLSVTNNSKGPVTVSSRLNIMEGDVQILLVGPDGREQKVTGAGGQPDTFPREATLQPGQQIVGAVNLLYTDIGQTFTTPGSYKLQAVYFPAPDAQPVNSNIVTLEVRSPQTDVEQRIATILKDDDVKRAIVIPETDHLPEGLKELASDFVDTPDGELASLIIDGAAEGGVSADSVSRSFSSDDPVKTAMQITALTTPFSNIGSDLRDSYATHLDNLSPGTEELASDDAGQTERALNILKTEPFK